ncbi:ribosomal protein S18 acetylase RimI-like enzyme [Rhizobium azooxidifex]|uniref:Ribosomal protein S18 acetylase RimI-like enzyme n=1 Tax=Mycoplana azooxidifex TaxID=1636188 RepID=A0A7W6D773_9HYPH|nr:GNAT family N-acetyltransferase [Mycoplana azooxidifex]MBB3975896.1 ribosomal protein S18 acetylase RimI-like enzyme [Mycoplana azooxidifex]
MPTLNRERGAEVEQNSQIGPAGPDDFPAIRALCNGFLDWCRSRYGENAWFVDRYYTPEQWASLLNSLPRIHAAPDGEILVARLDGKVVGCVMMQRIDKHTCEMKRMFIGPEGRGLGLGRRLAETLVRVAAERGYTTMRLDTGRNHDEALRLYRSLGFMEITPYYEAPPELRNHLVFMEASLAA